MTIRLGDVFVVGGQPTVTYVTRNEQRHEEKLREYLEFGHTVISVTGATKSGKTVLCRNVIPPDEHVWIQGGDLRTETDLWSQIVHRLQLPAQTSAAQETKSSINAKAGLNIGDILKRIIPFRLDAEYENEQTQLGTKTYDHGAMLEFG